MVGIKTKLSSNQAPGRGVQLTQYLTNEELGIMGLPSVREGGKLPKRSVQVIDTKLIYVSTQDEYL